MWRTAFKQTGLSMSAIAGQQTKRSLQSLGLDVFVRHGNWQNEPCFTGLSVDSRQTEKGHLFAAMPGTTVHGAEFADYARRMGAAAVLTDQDGSGTIEKLFPDFELPVIVAENARLALSETAARFFDLQPEVVVAVTGTNGKTSVASFTRQIWENCGAMAVNFGTTGVEGAISAPLSHTTPEPITLHRLLAELSTQGVTHAAMEASSHGLAQRRLDAVDLTAAAFTNITRDHLDYHESFSDYLAAKMGLFDRVLRPDGVAVLNSDDPVSFQIADVCRGRGGRPIFVGRSDEADIQLTAQRFDAAGQDIRFTYKGEAFTSRLDLIGGFQALNALIAAGLAIGSGLPPVEIFGSLAMLKTVRGRMQLAATRRNGATVFVDYAHTPDALETALTNLRPHVLGRLIVVFGAGGDRDPGKRELMGQAAAEFSDVVFVTDDNPRGEDASAIRQAVLKGCPDANEIGDRAEAILAGVDALGPGDTLLVAGKGHETGQIIGNDIFPFDDVEQASIAVAALDELGV